MPKQDYIPQNKYELKTYSKSFVTTEEKHVNHYGINEEEIKTTKINVTNYGKSIDVETDLKEQLSKQYDKSKQLRKILVKDLRVTAQMIKNSPDYTTDIGKEFNIIGPENPFNRDTFKPVLQLKKRDHGVEISFNKSETDGINLYRRKTGETDFTFISRDTNSPYIDNKDIVAPVKIEYYAMAVIDDEEIGIESDTAKITI